MHSEEMKPRTLLKKIKADFLVSCKASIEVAMSVVPMTMTYDHALNICICLASILFWTLGLQLFIFHNDLVAVKN